MSEPTTALALHYFRVPRPQWELMLARIRQLGVNTVFSPVPWHLHEFAPERFDLTGLTSPRRNLKAFVELCAVMGFAVVLDVSPLHPAENLLNDGLPGWLLSQHPETRAVNAAGQPQNRPSPAHPAFLPLAKRWAEQLSQTLQAARHPAGPVQIQLGLSLDAPDFNEHVAAVQWPIWLRKRYAESGGVDGLNAAYAPPTPYHSISQVRLTDRLDSPAFQQDVAAFAADVQAETRALYTAIWQDAGWQLLPEPLAGLRHAARIDPDAPDVGQSFRWATDAPLRIDGTPRFAFWQVKELNLPNELSPDYQILYTPPTEQTLFEVGPQATAYRLLLNGKLEPATIAADGRLAYVQTNRTGRTDFYFTVADAAAPLSGYLQLYLRSLLNGQRHALAFARSRLLALLKAMEPPTAPAAAPESPVLTEAQAALSEANQALAKAAASIGALEDVFATALNKEQPAAPNLPFAALDGQAIPPVKQAAQAGVDRLAAVLESPLPAALTPAGYQKGHIAAANAAIEVMDELQKALLWLREQLAAGNLPPVNWTAHAHLETVLKTLANGVLRS